MEYVIGLVLGLAIGGFAALIGFDRDRSFYPTVLIVIASYYVLFGVMGGGGEVMAAEIAMASLFFLLAVVGFKTTPWIVAAATIGHGVFDFFHRRLISNPGVPQWWPGFCLAFDVSFGACLVLLLIRQRGLRETAASRA